MTSQTLRPDASPITWLSLEQTSALVDGMARLSLITAFVLSSLGQCPETSRKSLLSPAGFGRRLVYFQAFKVQGKAAALLREAAKVGYNGQARFDLGEEWNSD